MRVEKGTLKRYFETGRVRCTEHKQLLSKDVMHALSRFLLAMEHPLRLYTVIKVRWNSPAWNR